jgi:NAD(P)-dependent dehydrogenase (short-subunit alcohol dehydrogenase family)
MHNLFDLTNKKALITGGAGLLGPKHAEAIIEFNGKVIIADIDYQLAVNKSNELNEKYGKNVSEPVFLDVTNKDVVNDVFNKFNDIDILINNAAKDPKVKKESSLSVETRFENMTFDYWKDGLDAIINGTFLCSQAAANNMILNKKEGIILNISSDLSIIAPDQRLYKKDNIPDNMQSVKPITYSAAKWAVVGMTKYLAVYFAEKNIRVNCLSPTGVFNNHPEDFVIKLSNIIPMGRMAHIDEYKGAVAFLCSKASSYMTGHNLVIDGGKTVW